MATSTILLPLLGGIVDDTDFPTPAFTTEARPYLIFDGTTDELISWHFRLPENYASGFTYYVQYSMDTAATNNVAIRCEIMTAADAEDIETDNYGAVEASADQTVPTTATHVKTISDAPTTFTLAADDYIAIRLGRENATSGTNATGNMFWWAVAIEYTTT